MHQAGARIVDETHGVEYRGRTGRSPYWLALPLVAALAVMLALGSLFPDGRPAAAAAPGASSSPIAATVAPTLSPSHAPTRPAQTATPFLGLRSLVVSNDSIWRMAIPGGAAGFPFAVAGDRIYYVEGQERNLLMSIRLIPSAEPEFLGNVDAGYAAIALAPSAEGVLILERKIAADSQCKATCASLPAELRVVVVRPDGGRRDAASYRVDLPDPFAVRSISGELLGARPGSSDGRIPPGPASTVQEPILPLLAGAGDRWAISLPVKVHDHWQSRIEMWDRDKRLWTVMAASPAFRLSVGGKRLAAVLAEPTGGLWQLVLADDDSTALQALDAGVNDISLSPDGRYLAWDRRIKDDCEDVEVVDADTQVTQASSACVGWASGPVVASGSRGANAVWRTMADTAGLILHSEFVPGNVLIASAGTPDWWTVAGDSVVWASFTGENLEFSGFDLSTARYSIV